MKRKIEAFLKAHNECAITDIIAEFFIDYKTVTDILSELYNERKVKQVGDNAVKYYVPVQAETDEEEELEEDNIIEADNLVSSELCEEFARLLKGPTEAEQVVKDLFEARYVYRSKKQMEKLCMDVIEKIAGVSFNKTRQEAIMFTEDLINLANDIADNKHILAIFERVKKEFEIATDLEYDNLRKQLL